VTGAAPALQLQGVTKRFGDFLALRGIDLAIEPGELVCFLGPSGCGKTTLLRIIAGLEVPSGGRLWQAGREITTLGAAQRDYGIVFQSYALFPNLTVADNVAYGLVNRRVPRAQARARVTELLALVGLPGSEGRYPAQLSGGQQQRIALARALATAPGLLLLDEPLSALDAIVRVHLRAEIKALQRQLGVTTIMVTHDQEEALAMADRIVVMNHGAIEQLGTPLQVYREPATPFVADFVGRVNTLQGQAAADGLVQLGTTTLHCAHGQRAGSALTVYLRPEDVLLAPAAAADAPNTVAAVVEKAEFLGAYCLLQLRSPALAGQALAMTVSMQQQADHALAPGATVALRLPAERLRVFG
jgi:iron(III) transport system ATP-binding protein